MKSLRRWLVEKLPHPGLRGVRLRRSRAAGYGALISLSLLLFLGGCQSARQPGSTSHASVQIQGRSLAEPQQTTMAVFREEGYGLAMSTPQLMVFERPGSRRDALKWGGLTGQGVTMRVKVQFSEMPDGCHLLLADAYALQNSDDPFFQTESRNLRLNRRPYQKLLDEVVKRLN